MSKLATEEILRRLIDAACRFVAAKFANHAPSKTEVRAMEAEIKAYLKITFAKFGAIIDKNWAEIFEKVIAVFPD
jgi:hypothetical protein